MQPQTVRLDNEEWEQLEREADERGFGNRTEYIRWIIRNRSAIEQHTASLEDRLAELETRMNQVESQIGE